MSLVVVITRDVEDRYRGFLASTMLEASPGIYVSKSLNQRARDKVWDIVSDWHGKLQRGSITMLFPDASREGGIAVRCVGTPSRRVVRLDGVLLMHRANP